MGPIIQEILSYLYMLLIFNLSKGPLLLYPVLIINFMEKQNNGYFDSSQICNKTTLKNNNINITQKLAQEQQQQIPFINAENPQSQQSIEQQKSVQQIIDIQYFKRQQNSINNFIDQFLSDLSIQSSGQCMQMNSNDQLQSQSQHCCNYSLMENSQISPNFLEQQQQDVKITNQSRKEYSSLINIDSYVGHYQQIDNKDINNSQRRNIKTKLDSLRSQQITKTKNKPAKQNNVQKKIKNEEKQNLKNIIKQTRKQLRIIKSDKELSKEQKKDIQNQVNLNLRKIKNQSKIIPRGKHSDIFLKIIIGYILQLFREIPLPWRKQLKTMEKQCLKVYGNINHRTYQFLFIKIFLLGQIDDETTKLIVSNLMAKSVKNIEQDILRLISNQKVTDKAKKFYQQYFFKKMDTIKSSFYSICQKRQNILIGIEIYHNEKKARGQLIINQLRFHHFLKNLGIQDENINQSQRALSQNFCSRRLNKQNKKNKKKINNRKSDDQELAFL